MELNKEFMVDPSLSADTVCLGDFPLCRALLMNDSHYPWCVLVPRRNDLTELYQLNLEDRNRLIAESCYLGEQMMMHFKGEKFNVAALGNQVAQLHVHHIVRFRNDPAWPQPIWGKLPPQPYLPHQIERLRSELIDRLKSGGLEPRME